jgi:uncharacterized membrane-anchored protein YitT (DUF2179 family)
MNPFIQLLLINKYASKHTGKRKSTYLKPSPYQKAKDRKLLRTSIRNQSKSFFLIILGILSASFGLKGFLIPNKLIDGGVTGISLLLNIISKFSISWLLIIINIPFIILGYTQSGKQFAIKSILSIIGLAISLALIKFPEITNDKLLVSVFGGFFLGAGIGFAIRGGGVLDGTEILAIFLNRKTGLSVGDFILCFNIIIFSVASLIIGIEKALYSVLIYLVASKAVDFLLQSIDEYIGVTIVTSRTSTMKLMIVNKLNKGVTIYKGSGGFGKRGESNSEMEILYTVISRLEISRLYEEINRIDPDAFVVATPIKETRGGMVRKK